MTRLPTVLCAVGSTLLLVMAVFHGSGYAIVTDAITESDASSFMKSIVPVLFVHVSIHLVGLSVLGFSTLFLKHGARHVRGMLAGLVLADAALGFYLSAWMPGILLLVTASCFVASGVLTPKPDERRDIEPHGPGRSGRESPA